MAKECSSCHRSFQDKLSHCPYDGAPLVRSLEPGEDPRLGSVIDGKYLIEAKLGEGGTCNVYRGKIVASGQPCAIKIPRGDLIHDEPLVRRFRQEVETAGLIRHANVVDMIASGEADDGTVYMVMELLEGITLKQVLQTQGPFGLERMYNIVKQICDALDAAHAKGIIHRDLKPDNIMLFKRGDEEVVKVFDFGIAKQEGGRGITGELQPSRIVMGTPRYMSPEQCLGHTLDVRSDIYSLGIIIYEMLAGVPPFTDTSARVLLNKHTQEAVPSLKRRRPGLPSIVERTVMHALEKSPLKRTQTARELAEELEIAIHTDPSVSPEQYQPVVKTSLVPVVKQVSGSVSIVEYVNKPEEPERVNPANKLLSSSGQIKTKTPRNINPWTYWLVAAIIVLIALIVLLIYLIVNS